VLRFSKTMINFTDNRVTALKHTNEATFVTLLDMRKKAVQQYMWHG